MSNNLLIFKMKQVMLKKIKLIFFGFFMILSSYVNGQEKLPSIYSPDRPNLVNIWHRVGDYSSGLRSVEAAEISADSKLVVSGAKYGYAVMLWRTADGTMLWEKAHESEVECVTFSPDSERIATGGEDFFVRIWNTEDGEEVHKIEHPSALDGIAWSNNGNLIAAGTEGGDIYLWDGSSYEFVAKTNVGSTINSIQFSKDDERVLVGGNIKYNDPESGNRIVDGFAKLLEVDGLKTVVEYEGPEGSVKSVRMTTDEKYVATGGFDRRARVFDLETGDLLRTFYEPDKIEAVAFTLDGHFLVTGGHEDKIRFYRMRDFSLVYELETARAEYINFSNDGRLMLTGHEDSGLLSLYLMISDTHRIPGLYDKMSRMQLNNRDLQK